MSVDAARERLQQRLTDYGRRHRAEAEVVDRFRRLIADEPRCFERSCWAGHITGSAWLVNAAGTHVLLTHHRKLDNWFQLGGHSDGDADTLRVAIREAEEESGLAVMPLADSIFDIDVHEIPARRDDPAHFHFDIRFALRVRTDETFRVSDESHDLAWVDISRLDEYTNEQSMVRMARKWCAWGRGR
jgi:8-oxo-dGTP pyrophosphatase MutT (NUDIX family)